MKQLYIFLSLIFVSQQVILGQATPPAVSQLAPEFDPQTMPVAVSLDSNLQLIVSDYVLSKSLKKQIPSISRVEDISILTKRDQTYLSFAIRLQNSSSQIFFYNILLYKGLQEAWYASNQSITCGSGCTDCRSGCECAGSGSCPSVAPTMRVSGFPLAKTTTVIEK